MPKLSLSILPLFLILASQLFGQRLAPIQVQLNWSPNFKSADGILPQQKYPHFEGAVYDESEMLPYWTYSLRLRQTSQIQAELQGATYEPLQTPVNWRPQLPDQIQTEQLFERGHPLAQIKILPIRYNSVSGQYEKLVQAQLKINLTASPSPLAQKSIIHPIQQSALTNGSIYKIAVSESGVYKIGYQQLEEMGWAPNSINPQQIQIFGNGGQMVPEIIGDAQMIDDLQELAIWVEGEQDGRFDANDYILFYAKGPKHWEYQRNSDRYRHQQNIYSKDACYFIKINSSTGRRISSRNNGSSPDYNSNSYDALSHHEVDEIALMEDVLALPPSGRLWLGNPFQISRNQNFNFTIPNRLPNEEIVVQSSFLARLISGTGSASLIISEGNQSRQTGTLGTVSSYVYALYAQTLNQSFRFVPSSSGNITLNYQFNHPSSGAEAWLDYISIQARAQLRYENSPLFFRDSRSLSANQAQYQIENAGGNLHLWDLTELANLKAQSFSQTGSNISFVAPADTLREFVLFNSDDLNTPNLVGPVENQNLHAINQSPQLLIIYHPNFASEAQRLAQHRQDHSGITSLAVDINQIYNEFSSGQQDATALRNFCRMLYERSSGNDSLRYLLLFGDGSFDPKGLSKKRTEHLNFVPSYQTLNTLEPLRTYTSDDFFALLDLGEGNPNANQALDIGVGRLPAASLSEASSMVNKIIDYDSNPTGQQDWRNRLTFWADDQDNNIHINDADNIARSVAANHPNYNINKIYADAFQQQSTSGGSRYPDVNTAILQDLFKGTLVVNYLGHGGWDGLAQERIFTLSEIQQMNTPNKLPLFVTATCSFAPFDDPNNLCAGEQLILKPNSGAIALLTTVRVVLADANQHLTSNTFDQLFSPIGNRMPTLGEVLQRAKNNSGILSASNSRKYVLLGDPSMTLAYPEMQVATTMINGQAPTGADSISALQLVQIEGEIQDQNNQLLSNFNGTIYPTVFDKADTAKTRGNDSDSQIRNFVLQKKTIFKGRATVTNGRFSFSFMVPKDINYTLGYGKISYYAEDGQNLDASGHYNGIVVGGTNPNASEDNDPPTVNVYMNDLNFAKGGVTDQNPLLLVQLEDDNGINTVGNGIGHDLTGILTYTIDDQTYTYNLNEFYQAEQDDFRKGSIEYPLNNLPEGLHQVQVKAWDVYNNMGEGNTEFVVADNAQMALKNILNYPNPFTEQTEFMFEHNLPGQELEVLVQIYTVSGKLIKTIQQPISAAENTGYRVDGIHWDGRDDFGDQLARGVYIYKLSLRSNGLSNEDEPEIKQEANFQKLVLLK